MNKEKQEKLTQFLKENPELQKKLNNLAKENSNDFNQQAAALLSGAGIEISVDDLKVPTDELSEDELMAIAGGGGCGCAAGGYGGGDTLYCWCIGYGSGGVNEKVDLITSKGGCACIGAGAGATNYGD